MAAEKYISSAWLLETIADYKNIRRWNTNVLDAETIARVLDVVENVIKGAPSIGQRKLGNKILAAKNVALEVHLKMAKDHIEDAERRYRRHESTNNLMMCCLVIDKLPEFKGLFAAHCAKYGDCDEMKPCETGRRLQGGNNSCD